MPKAGSDIVYLIGAPLEFLAFLYLAESPGRLLSLGAVSDILSSGGVGA